jgi:hypothetical protein
LDYACHSLLVKNFLSPFKKIMKYDSKLLIFLK